MVKICSQYVYLFTSHCHLFYPFLFLSPLISYKWSFHIICNYCLLEVFFLISGATKNKQNELRNVEWRGLSYWVMAFYDWFYKSLLMFPSVFIDDIICKSVFLNWKLAYDEQWVRRALLRNSRVWTKKVLQCVCDEGKKTLFCHRQRQLFMC